MTENTFSQLKERLNLLSEIEKDLGSGRKSGRWVHFLCPFHEDKDTPSLAVNIEDDRYHCFGCGANGDVIDWLSNYRKMNWKDIHDLAGSDPLVTHGIQPAVKHKSTPNGPPPAAWQCRGMGFIEYAESQLWGKPGYEDKIFMVGDELLSPLDYLHWRGLTYETIRFWRLGFNPQAVYDKRELWGFASDPDSKGIYLPQGITIPCLITQDWITQSKALWSIKVRRPSGKPKYQQVTGSRSALFGADNLYIASNGTGLGLLVEGEFDVMLLDQTIPEIAAATLGSASNHLDLITWGAYLLPLRWLLAAYDLDAPGAAGLAVLVGQAGRIHPVRVPCLRTGDKDITDYFQAGGDLWEWSRYHLDRLGVLRVEVNGAKEGGENVFFRGVLSDQGLPREKNSPIEMLKNGRN